MQMGPPERGEPTSLSDSEGWGLGDAWLGIAASFVLSNLLIGPLILIAAGWTEISMVPMWGLGLLQIPLWFGYVGAVVVAGRKGSGVRAAFGFRIRAIDVPIGLGVGVICQLVLLPLLYWPIFELTGTDSEELSEPAKQLASRAGGNISWLLFALLVGLMAPVIEELFYRGLLLQALRKRGFNDGAAVALSALVFASLHLQLLQFPGLFLFGLIAALLAVLIRRLGMSIFAHIAFNMTTVVVLYLNYRDHLP